MVGRTISHYRVLEKLGSGGMGDVYKAEDLKLGRTVALKFLKADALDNEEAKTRFMREARAAAALDHSNVCAVHDIDEEDGRTFLAMSFVDGESIREKLAKRPLPLDEALDYAVQAAQGLQAAHGKRINHRDVKSANLMVTEEGQVKVMDFGLAQLADQSRLTKTTTFLGTPAYMSPEQAQRQPTDARSDIWSLGVVLYEMVCGRLPFVGENEHGILYGIVSSEPEPLTALRTGLPVELDRIVGKAMAKKPEERYQHVEDMLVDLRTLRGAEVDHGKGSQPKRRTNHRVAVVTALALATALGAIYSLVSREASPPDPAWTIRPLTTFDGTEWQPSWSPDASLIAYAGTAHGSVDIFVEPASGGNQLRLTDHAADDNQPRWSPDGQNIAFLSDRSGGANVYVISSLGPLGTERKLAETNLHRDLVLNNGLGAQPWSPDGRELLFSRRLPDGRIALWKINLATGAEGQVTFPPPDGEDWDASWSFDGAEIAFAGSRDGKTGVRVMTAGGGGPRLLVEGGEYPAWSADNRRIVFSARQGGPQNIWELDIDPGRLRKLTTGPGSDRKPVVATSGSVAYAHFTHRLDLYLVQWESGEEERLTFHNEINVNARVSPDGKSIVYRSNRTGNNEICLLDLENRTERQLTDHPGEDLRPDWSPDGQQIVFLSSRDGELHLWVMGSDGGSQRRLTQQSIPPLGRQYAVNNSNGAPRWSPDGEVIGYLAPAEGGSALWLTDRDGKAVPSRISGSLISFDWYKDSRHVIYARMATDGSDQHEMLVADLDTAEEAILHRGPHTELAVAPDGSAVSFSHSLSHFNQRLYLLRLAPPAAEGELPRSLGQARELTDGKGIWHVHNGGWSPDGKSLVYTRDTDQSDIYVIEGYR